VVWTAAFLVAVVLAAYLPAVHGAFLWDDDAHVTRPDLRSLEGLWRIWCDFGATQQYYPLLHTAFWVQHRWWGNEVAGYHLASILLHAGSACLLLFVLRRLRVPGATLAAAVFALHPVHVDSVAWISEQKNTLSMAFYLAALLTYLRFDDERDGWQYWAAFGLFVLGLLTKTVVATLPGALLIIFWWQRGQLAWRRDVLPLAPWFAVGGAAGLVTAWIERRMLGAEGSDFAFSFVDRVLLAGRVVWFDVGRLLWPTDLMFVYPRWRIDASNWTYYLHVAGVVGALAACWAVRRRFRAPLAVALFFMGSLFPVLGFVNVYPFVFSFVADHFQYVPSLGIIAGAAAGLTLLARRVPTKGRWLETAGGAALLCVLATLTWQRSHLYSNPVALYEDTLARNAGCYLCLNNLGTLAVRDGRLDEALDRFHAAVQVKPDSAEALTNLANLLVESGSIAEGIEHFRRALAAAPNNVVTRTNLGIALYRLGRIRDAQLEFERVLRTMPDYGPARQNLSVILALPGRQ
jgi:protein O-mannosyl-transferase